MKRNFHTKQDCAWDPMSHSQFLKLGIFCNAEPGFSAFLSCGKACRMIWNVKSELFLDALGAGARPANNIIRRLTDSISLLGVVVRFWLQASLAGLRKVMLRAHRQAWCWQDEWIDLTMDDIRRLEEETALMLAKKMAKCIEPDTGPAVSNPEGPAELSNHEKPDRADSLLAPDSSPDDPFAKQWSSSSRSSYSSQHAGE